jgi:hypothetical protein
VKNEIGTKVRDTIKRTCKKERTPLGNNVSGAQRAMDILLLELLKDPGVKGELGENKRACY